MKEINTETGNTLFPVFLKLKDIHVLIVGGGSIGYEKIRTVLTSNPETKLTLVAINILPQIIAFVQSFPNAKLINKAFDESDLEGKDIVIAAVNDKTLSGVIANLANKKKILINVADTPDLCDFYLGSIVKKGNLKIAISTNGKSPTIAKRLKEVFAETLPDELDEILNNMHVIRNELKGDFTAKVNKLNTITSDLASKSKTKREGKRKDWVMIASLLFFVLYFFTMTYLVFSGSQAGNLVSAIRDYTKNIEQNFYWMIVTGFIAELVCGSLGMGYGVICTSVLLSLGVPLPVMSGCIHTAELLSSAATGFSHYKLGHLNKKLFVSLLLPGIIGAVTGAFLLIKFGEKYAANVKPMLACYTLFIGIKILLSFNRKSNRSKVKRIGWLAGFGGLLDSFGGGGWGPLVTSKLISRGKTPKYVIGSVSISKFFITLASAITFFFFIGISHWQIIAGLVIGGLIAAPVSAKVSSKLPVKTMFIAVGIVVIIWSLTILFKACGIF